MVLLIFRGKWCFIKTFALSTKPSTKKCLLNLILFIARNTYSNPIEKYVCPTLRLHVSGALKAALQGIVFDEEVQRPVILDAHKPWNWRKPG